MSNTTMINSSKVSDIADYREHVNVYTEHRTHVIPLSCFTDILARDMAIEDIEDHKEIMEVIIAEWLAGLKRKTLLDITDCSKLYSDLLYQVETKFPNESRHETAKRYIVNAENHSNPPAKAD